MMKSRLFGTVGIVAVVGGIAGVVAAQTPAKPPAFDVASVKTNMSGDDSVDMNPTSTGITIHNATLQVILRLAFRVQDEQILGGPDWVTKTRFDVVARSETPFPRDELRTRLQTLLAERFALRTHNETRERPVYALVRASKGQFGPQIHAPSSCVSANTVPDGSPSACSNSVIAGRMSGRGATMWTLAVNLSVFTGRTVVDQTGFAQTFDYDLEWNPDGTQLGGAPAATSSSSDRPSLFAALQEQLGLKLQSTRGPVDVLVIDHVERPAED
jgi:uncharacterized protein (TIGR03435 family)